MNKFEKHCKRPSPSFLLFDSKLWSECKSNLNLQPVGLQNLGNTCFINSAIQCLSYTSPLIDYLFGCNHRSHCKIKEHCCMCQLQKLIEEMANCNGKGFVPPIAIFNRLKATCNMEPGHQQDSHEFLRYLIDRMTHDALFEFKQYTGIERETTAIHQIFGGYLRSEVKCYTCKNKCFTYDLFMDLSVDVKNMKTLEEALKKYVQPEVLKNGNAYYCRTCQRIKKAKKTMTIYRAPNILTLHFKRFKFVNRPQRIQNTVEYNFNLNIKDFLTKSKSEDINYQLYAVLLHHSHSANGGHYTCYVKHKNNLWYHLNDAKISCISEERVINDPDAYVLFYKRPKMNIWESSAEKRTQICSDDTHSSKSFYASEDGPKTSTPILFNENSLPVERPKISFAIRPHFTTRLSGIKTFNGRLMTPISSLIDDDSDSENSEVNQDKVQKGGPENEPNNSTTLLSNLTNDESLKLFPESKSNDEFSEVCDQVGSLMKDWSEIQSPNQEFSFDDQITDFSNDPLILDRIERKTTQASWRSLLESIDAGIDDQSRQSPTTEKLMALKQMAKENAGEIKDNRESIPTSYDVTGSVYDARDKCSSQLCVEKSTEKKSRVGKFKKDLKDKTTDVRKQGDLTQQKYKEFNLPEKTPISGFMPHAKKNTIATSVNDNGKVNQKMRITEKYEKKKDNTKKELQGKKLGIKRRRDKKDKFSNQSTVKKEKFLQTELLLDTTPILENDDIIQNIFESSRSSNPDSSKDEPCNDTDGFNSLNSINDFDKVNKLSVYDSLKNSTLINTEDHLLVETNEFDSTRLRKSDLDDKVHNEANNKIVNTLDTKEKLFSWKFSDKSAEFENEQGDPTLFNLEALDRSVKSLPNSRKCNDDSLSVVSESREELGGIFYKQKTSLRKNGLTIRRPNGQSLKVLGKKMSAFEKTYKNLQRHSLWDGKYFQVRDQKTLMLKNYKELLNEEKSNLKVLTVDPNKYDVGPPKFTKDLHHIEKWLVKSIITPGPQTPVPSYFSFTNNPEGYRQLARSTTSAFYQVIKKERPMQSAIDFLTSERRLHHNRSETPIVQPLRVIKGINNQYHLKNLKANHDENDTDDAISVIDDETGDVFTFLPKKESENPASTRVEVRRNNDELMEIEFSTNLNELNKDSAELVKHKIKKESASENEISEIVLPDLSRQSHLTIHEEELDAAEENIPNVTKPAIGDDKERNCNNFAPNCMLNSSANHKNDMIVDTGKDQSVKVSESNCIIIERDDFDKLNQREYQNNLPHYDQRLHKEQTALLANVPKDVRMRNYMTRSRVMSYTSPTNKSSEADEDNDKENDDEVAAITEDHANRNKSLRIKSAKVRSNFIRTESAARKKEVEAKRLKMIKENADYLKRFQTNNVGSKLNFNSVHLMETRSKSRTEDKDPEQVKSGTENDSRKILKRKLSEKVTPSKAKKRQKLSDDDPPVLTKEEPRNPNLKNRIMLSPPKLIKEAKNNETFSLESSYQKEPTKNFVSNKNEPSTTKVTPTIPCNNYSEFHEAESNAQQLLKRMYEDPIETEIKDIHLERSEEREDDSWHNLFQAEKTKTNVEISKSSNNSGPQLGSKPQLLHKIIKVKKQHMPEKHPDDTNPVSDGGYSSEDDPVKKKKAFIEAMPCHNESKVRAKYRKQGPFKIVTECCPRNCYLNVPTDVQKYQYELYYSKDFKEQSEQLLDYLSSDAASINCSRRKWYYHVLTNDKEESVCRHFLLKMLKIPLKRLRTVIEKVRAKEKGEKDEIQLDDMRGRHVKRGVPPIVYETLKSFFEKSGANTQNVLEVFGGVKELYFDFVSFYESLHNATPDIKLNTFFKRYKLHLPE